MATLMYLLVSGLCRPRVVFHKMSRGFQFKFFYEVNVMFKRKLSIGADEYTEKTATEEPASTSSDESGVKNTSSYSQQASAFFESDERQSFMKIRRYVDQHGFGPTTPDLAIGLSSEIFLKHYYDKQTLLEFCREHGIPSQGQKNELTCRIEHFLRTGKILHVNTPKKNTLPFDSELGLSLDRQVVNYKSDPVTRRFFEKHIPQFTGFSAYVQKWLKERLANNENFTYAEVIEEHKQYLRDKTRAQVRGEATKVAHDSCQFNQFYIDYSHDPAKKPHTAKKAWELVRDSAGDKTYKRYQDKIQEISALVDAQPQDDEDQITFKKNKK